MKRNSLICTAGRAAALLLMTPTALLGFGWGQKGHDTTAAIATRHLTPRTAAAVDFLLKGQSMVYWANWLDNASHTPEYAYSKTWHYKNIDPDETFENAYIYPGGDIIIALNEQTRALRNPATTPADAALALKMVIHLMGDLHQPLHMGRRNDLGGNKRQVKFFSRDTNLHSVWDTSLPDIAHKWSYTEWVDQIDRATPAMEAVITAGDFTDWGKETYGLATEVYEATPEGTVVSYDYIARWTPVIEQQFLKGGLRLAYILNSIYDPEFMNLAGEGAK